MSLTKVPTVFSFNIRRSVYQHFGLSAYGHLQSRHKFHLLPVIVDEDSSIESRSNTLNQNLNTLLKSLKAEKCNLVSYSLSGVDARYAISALNTHNHVKKLITVSSPHKGSILADAFEKKGFDAHTVNMVTRAIGVGTRAFFECVPSNMTAFNTVALNKEEVEYFSFGGMTHPSACSDVYMKTHQYLRLKTRRHLLEDNDGVFRTAEIEWGTHVCNFEYDHSGLIGMTDGFKHQPIKLIKQIIHAQKKAVAV